MLCPTCRRILPGNEAAATLCCANASGVWRCTLCGETSEGFAFPFGLCPLCSGRLERVDDGAGVEAAAVEGVRMAFEIELGGRAFYQRAAADSEDPELRALFSRFALMEGEHMETLSRRYHLDAPSPSKAMRVEVAAVFAEIENRPQDPDNLFRIAIGLEQRAMRFFESRAARPGLGADARRLFRELADEEREHAALLAHSWARWQAGESGQGDPFVVPAQGSTMNGAALLLQGQPGAGTAIECRDGSRVDYATLREQVARAAALLRERGVGPGRRVAVKLSDGPDWVVAFLGTIWAGGIAVGVNPRVPVADWQYILDEAGFSLILAEGVDDTPWPWRERVLLLPAWREELPRHAPVEPAPMDENAPAFWCHSSGTSGKPKAVVHAQRSLRRIDQVSREGMGITAADRIFASSKLFFAYPLCNLFLAGLKIGATLLLDPQWPTAESVAASVAALRPTVLLSVPSLYRNLLHEGRAPAIAQAGVRLCVSAGEALPASLRDEWRRQTGLSIVNGYGASETLILVMLDRGDGQGFSPSPGVGIEPLHDVDPGMPTRLLIRAATLALGYLDRPQAQSEAFRDGAFCPADLFVREAPGGGWRFAGREDSLVKIHGRWVNLVELEERLSQQASGIAEAAAVCVPDADGVDAVAFFFVAGDAAAVGAALQAGALALPPHQRPRWMHAVEALPRTATGKILRRKLQDMHRALG